MARKKSKKIKINPKEQQPESVEAEQESIEEAPDHLEEQPESLTEATQEVDQLKQQLQRVAADYQNFQKRSQKQIAQAGQFARQDLVKALLAVLDNFEHTFNGFDESLNAADVIKGVQIIYDQLLNILSSQSLDPIEVKPGDPFDPTLHEAMLRQESDAFEDNAVIAEFARGYTMNGMTLRPAKVSVARAVQPTTDETDGEQEKINQETNDADL